MKDMNSASKLFIASSKLQIAASWLEKISKQNHLQPDSIEKEALQWCGNFLYQVDWSANYSMPSSAENLALQATSIRPTFYTSLMRLIPKLENKGIDTDKKVIAFLKELYGYLLENKNSKNRKKINHLYAELGSELFNDISQSIFIQFTNNGLPRASTSQKISLIPNTYGFAKTTLSAI